VGLTVRCTLLVPVGVARLFFDDSQARVKKFLRASTTPFRSFLQLYNPHNGVAMVEKVYVTYNQVCDTLGCTPWLLKPSTAPARILFAFGHCGILFERCVTRQRNA
jgi:hypothetical protein